MFPTRSMSTPEPSPTSVCAIIIVMLKRAVMVPRLLSSVAVVKSLSLVGVEGASGEASVVALCFSVGSAALEGRSPPPLMLTLLRGIAWPSKRGDGLGEARDDEGPKRGLSVESRAFDVEGRRLPRLGVPLPLPGGGEELGRSMGEWRADPPSPLLPNRLEASRRAGTCPSACAASPSSSSPSSSPSDSSSLLSLSSSSASLAYTSTRM